MGNLIFKPASGGQLILQDEGGDSALTIGTDGKTTLVPSTPLSHRNMIINGDFRVNQVGAKTGITAETRQAAGDRWTFNLSDMGTWAGGTEADAPTGEGFHFSGYANCTTAKASPASTSFATFTTRLEGQDLQHIRKGTSNAKPVTLSFWVKSPKTGIHIAELYDGDNSRSCSQSYTIASANTWEYFALTYPADTTGAFDNDNLTSLYIQFHLGAGSNYTSGTLRTTWDTGTAANRVVGQVNVADAIHSTNNYFQLTGVQLELGSSATPFEHRSYGDELARCLRYFCMLADGSVGSVSASTGQSTPIGLGQMYNSTVIYMVLTWPVAMRTEPTIYEVSGTDYFKGYTNAAGFLFNAGWSVRKMSPYAGTILSTTGTGAAGDAIWIELDSQSARLGFNAEL